MRTPGLGPAARVARRARQAASLLQYRLRLETWSAAPAAVISHPKSGRTWLRLMLHEAGVTGIPFSHAGSSEEAAVTAAALFDGVAHWQDRRILFLLRDPRDTIASFYFQATRRTCVYAGTFADFLRDPRFGIERAVRFNLLWLAAQRRFPDFTLLSYEAMHADPHGALRHAARFLAGRQLPEPVADEAVRRNRFDRLHACERSGDGRRLWGARLAPGNVRDPESFKTRRGIVGGWRDYFTPADTDYADAVLAAHDYVPRLAAAGVPKPAPAAPRLTVPAPVEEPAIESAPRPILV